MKQYSCKNCCIVKPKMKKCSDCKVARYCSVKCQQNDWKQDHREKCSKEYTTVRDCDSCYSMDDIILSDSGWDSESELEDRTWLDSGTDYNTLDEID